MQAEKQQITFLDVQSGAFVNALWKLVVCLTSFVARKPLTKIYLAVTEGLESPNKLWLKHHQEFGEEVKDERGNINYRVDVASLEPERARLYNETVKQIGGTVLYTIDTPIKITLPESKANSLSETLNLMEQSLLEKFIDIDVVADSEIDKLRAENAKLKTDLTEAKTKNDQATKVLAK